MILPFRYLELLGDVGPIEGRGLNVGAPHHQPLRQLVILCGLRVEKDIGQHHKVLL